MNFLAKLTTISIALLFITYIVIFYNPVTNNSVAPQDFAPTPTTTPTQSQTQSPEISISPVSQTTSSPNPSTDSRCIITLDGSRYDVTQFRFIHPGGDIFQCGSDMSVIFHNRHSNRFLQQMDRYKI